MAHPHKSESVSGHNAKLKRLTENYGSASGEANNMAAPTNRYKQEGPEPAIGFGADSERPRGRADRASRKQGVSNPVATLKRGGTPKRAHGGRMKGKKHGGTHVNVLVAPQGGGGAPMARPVAAVPPMLPGAPPAAAMPPRPPMPPGAPMGAGPMPGAGGPPMAPGAPGGLPPGLIPPRKRGGAVKRDTGGSATSSSGDTGGNTTMSRAAMVDKAMRERPEPGQMEGRKHGGKVHADERQDTGLIHKILKNEGLVRSDKPAKVRAHGGHIKHHLDAGAGSGPGRLEKIGEKAKNAGPPQAV